MKNIAYREEKSRVEKIDYNRRRIVKNSDEERCKKGCVNESTRIHD